jgi:hypothetical protein
MGRVAGIVGPAMTSVLLANNSLQFVLMFIAVPDLIVAVICIALAYYSRQAVVPQSEPTPDRVRA